MFTVNITTLINYLNTITNITNIVGNRIFYGLPNNEQTETYITINKITSRSPTGIEWIERIEFRYIRGNATKTFAFLEDLDNKVFLALQEYREDGVYKVISSNSFNGYDEKQRKFFLRDYLFHKTI